MMSILEFMLGMEAPFLWSIPLGILGIIIVYGAAKYGQSKGKAQMTVLQDFLNSAVLES